MKKYKIGQILMFTSFGLLLGFLVTVMVLSALGAVFPNWSAAIFLSVIGVAFAFLGAGIQLIAGKGIIYRKRRLYRNTPYKPVDDYEAELNIMRENFAADKSADKNRMPRMLMGREQKPHYDFSVLKSGTVRYGYLVEANDILFSKGNLNSHTLPAVFVFSTDEYYDKNPLALRAIAEKLFKNRNINILKNERKFFYNHIVNDELCGGRKVYMTTVFVYRPHLPTGYIAEGLLPVVTDPEHCTATFILEDGYWSEAFRCNFLNAGDVKKRIANEIEKCAALPLPERIDFAEELLEVNEAYDERYGDEYKVEEAQGDGEPFAEFGKEATKAPYRFNYGYVVYAEARYTDPYSVTRDDVFPVVALVSDDDLFKSDPYAYKVVADKFYALPKAAQDEVRNKVIDYKSHGLSEVRLPDEVTGGKEVYAYGVLVDRGRLPTLAVTHNLIPVITFNEKNGGMTLCVKEDFWTEALIANYARKKLDLGGK